MSHLSPIDDVSFDHDVLRSDLPVLIDVTARWCGPCRRQLPIVEKVAAALEGRVRVVTLDVDEAPATVVRLGIRGAPTLILFARGREVARQVGLAPETIVRRMIDDALGGATLTA